MPDINMQHFGELQRNQHSIDIEIDASQIASPQQDFPMMLETPNSSNSALNVVAINELGEQLPTEIEGVANDKNWVHLKDLVQSVVNRKMKVFYGGCDGKPAADSTYGSQAVWDGNYLFVNHMTSISSLADSTSNSNDYTTVVGNPTLHDGNFGKKIYFDGSDGFRSALDIYSYADFNNGMTFTARTDMASGGSDPQIITIEGYYWIGTDVSESSKFGFEFDGNGVPVVSSAVADSNWHVVTGVGDSGTSQKIYVDNVSMVSGTATRYNIDGVSRNSAIGCNYAGGANFITGYIAESRISNIDRSADYVATIHKNLNNPTAVGTNPFYKSISKEHNFAESLQSLGRAG